VKLVANFCSSYNPSDVTAAWILFSRAGEFDPYPASD